MFEDCSWCETATANLRAATNDDSAVAACTMHGCPVVVGQQNGVGPGLFITCGKPHTVQEHHDSAEVEQ